jgi:hypothetical protein
VFDISAAALFALSRVDPRLFPSIGFLLGSTLYGFAFALLAGYIAGRIAGFQAVAHALGVAIIIGGTALVSLIAEWANGSIWSQLAVIIVMTPAAVIGGVLYEREAAAAVRRGR